VHRGIFDAEQQVYQPAPGLTPGTQYEFEIDVRGNKYTVDLTNLATNAKTRTSTFTNGDGTRGVGAESGAPVGFVGLQSYPGAAVAFRRIELKP
jgi:hypothetical protein